MMLEKVIKGQGRITFTSVANWEDGGRPVPLQSRCSYQLTTEVDHQSPYPVSMIGCANVGKG